MPFSSLAARPPTPPRDVTAVQVVEEAINFLDDSFETERALEPSTVFNAPVNTPPPHTPLSTAEPANTDSTRRPKKVNFSAWPTSHLPTDTKAGISFHAQTLRPLPQQKKEPLKSILKPQSPSTSFNGGDHPQSNQGSISAHKYETFAEMLDHIVTRLANEAREVRLDAYIALLGTLKAQEKIPAADVQTFKDKMSLLMQFIRRDITAQNRDLSTPDTNLVTQAIKLLTVFVREPALADNLDSEFRAAVLDKAIEALESQNPSKAILNTYLALLSTQNFPQRVMTNARAERIVKALNDVEKRVSGNGINAYRLAVYQKLLRQTPDVMAAQSQAWFEHIFHGMASSNKDIRSKAIETGMVAGAALGSNAQASKAILDLLGKASEGGPSYADYLENRLQKMANKEDPSLTKEDFKQATEIWTVVILFTRARRPHFSDWRHFKLWLQLFQNFLNSSSSYVVMFSTIAWRRFIFVVNPNIATEPALIRLLRQAVLGLLKQKSTDKSARDIRSSILSTCFVLFYYGLRPSASAKELDLYWQEFVVPSIETLLEGPPKDPVMACRILSTLLNGSPSRPWNEERALSSEYVTLEEVPRLDPKWTRQRLPRLLAIVRPCLNQGFRGSVPPQDSAAGKLWSDLLSALAEAGSNEVKASIELKQAIAAITSMLDGFWRSNTKCLGYTSVEEEDWMARFWYLLESTMEKLGPLNLSEKILTRNGEADFEVSPTPSHRQRSSSPLISPLQHIIRLLSTETRDHCAESMRIDLLKRIIQLAWQTRNTRLSKLEILGECKLSVEAKTADADIQAAVWMKIAELTKASLQDDDVFSPKSHTLAKEYRTVLDILCTPLARVSSDILKASKHLLDGLINTVMAEVGEGGVVLAITEPLAAGAVRGIGSERAALCAAILLEKASIPRNRRVLEHGRRLLGQSEPTEKKTNSFDPYVHFYDAIVGIMSLAYQRLKGHEGLKKPDSNESVQSWLITSLASSIKGCPLTLSAIYLRRMQEGIAVWIKDEERQLESQDPFLEELYRSVCGLWEAVCAAIEALPKTDSALLSALNVLIAAGFSSRRKRIVNLSVKTWNATFGRHETLEYPHDVEQVLKKLQPLVEIQLPTFPDPLSDEGSLPSFFDSQDESEEDNERSSRPHVPPLSPGPRLIARMISSSPASRSTTPRRFNSKSPTRQTPRARLRHDNSQIQFEAIESSPPDRAAIDSQVLTDRQKEVNERQRNETAIIFSSLGSSPHGSTVQDANISLLDFRKTKQAPIRNDGATTPKGRQPSLGPMLSYLGSSPTPRAQTNRIAGNLTFANDDTGLQTATAQQSSKYNLSEDPPSSPPEMGCEKLANGPPALPYENVQDSFIGDESELSELSDLEDSFEESTIVDLNVDSKDKQNDEDAQSLTLPVEQIETGQVGTELEPTDNAPIAQTSPPEVEIDAQLTAEIDSSIERSSPSKEHQKAAHPPERNAPVPGLDNLTEQSSPVKDMVISTAEAMPSNSSRGEARAAEADIDLAARDSSPGLIPQTPNETKARRRRRQKLNSAQRRKASLQPEVSKESITTSEQVQSPPQYGEKASPSADRVDDPQVNQSNPLEEETAVGTPTAKQADEAKARQPSRESTVEDPPTIVDQTHERESANVSDTVINTTEPNKIPDDQTAAYLGPTSAGISSGKVNSMTEGSGVERRHDVTEAAGLNIKKRKASPSPDNVSKRSRRDRDVHEAIAQDYLDDVFDLDRPGTQDCINVDLSARKRMGLQEAQRTSVLQMRPDSVVSTGSAEPSGSVRKRGRPSKTASTVASSAALPSTSYKPPALTTRRSSRLSEMTASFEEGTTIDLTQGTPIFKKEATYDSTMASPAHKRQRTLRYTPIAEFTRVTRSRRLSLSQGDSQNSDPALSLSRSLPNPRPTPEGSTSSGISRLSHIEIRSSSTPEPAGLEPEETPQSLRDAETGHTTIAFDKEDEPQSSDDEGTIIAPASQALSAKQQTQEPHATQGRKRRREETPSPIRFPDSAEPKRRSIQRSQGLLNGEKEKGKALLASRDQQMEGTVQEQQPPPSPSAPDSQVPASPAADSAASTQATAPAQEPATPSRGRRILRPTSIIERLKRLVVDCKNLVLGRDEHLQVQGLLLEVTQEVHDAAKRGMVAEK